MLMVVTNNEIYGKTFERVLTTLGCVRDVLACSHDTALENFLLNNPTHVLVCEYEEGIGKGKYSMGQGTWRDIKASARPDQHLLRSGFMKCNAPDFIRQPILLAELIEKLFPKGG